MPHRHGNTFVYAYVLAGSVRSQLDDGPEKIYLGGVHQYVMSSGLPRSLTAWREAGTLFSDEERAALQWAESVTLVSRTGVPDASSGGSEVRREGTCRPHDRDRLDQRQRANQTAGPQACP